MPDLRTLFADDGKVAVELAPLPESIPASQDRQRSATQLGQTSQQRQPTMSGLFQRHGTQPSKSQGRKSRPVVVEQLSLFGGQPVATP